MKTKLTLRILRRWDAFLKRLHTWLKAQGVPLCDGMYGECFCKGSRRRQYTQYVLEGSNWVFLCDTCMEANDEYWKEMWKEYYGGVL